MGEFLIKRNDIVSVLNYSSQPGRYNHYIGVVQGIILPGEIEVSEFICITGSGDRNTKCRIKVAPKYKIGRNSFIWDQMIPDPIGDDIIYREDPHNVTIFKPEDYETMRIQFLTKLNILSNLLFGSDEFRLERLVDKPKPFNLKS